MSEHKNRLFILYPILIVFIAVVYTFVSSFVPLVGDDLAHIRDYGTNYPSLWLYPKFIAVHWINISGRWGNHLMPMMMNHLPLWVNYLLNGVMTAAFFALVVRVSGFARRGDLFLRLTLVALLMFTMCWWDSMLLFCCSYNYVWATAIGIAFLWVFFKTRWDDLRAKWIVAPLLCVLAGMAGSMHEAMSIPLACGMGAYFFLTGNYCYTDRFQRTLLLFFSLGVLMVITSPGLWLRVGGGAEANDPMWLLVLKSDFYALLLVPVLVALWLKKRNFLERMAHSEWIIFAVAAIVSMAFSAVGGIVGRSGWFAQVFALISLYILINNIYGGKVERTFKKILALVLFALMVAHLTQFALTQRQLGAEFDEVVAQYGTSSNGVVYSDITGDEHLPWWLLHKCRSVPDPDDTYLKYTIAKYHGDESRWPVIVPRRMQTINVAQMPPSIEFDGIVVTRLYPKTERHSTVEMFDYQKFHHDGITYVVEPFEIDGRQLYLVSPRDLDPGDR